MELKTSHTFEDQAMIRISEFTAGCSLDVLQTLTQAPAHFWSTDRELRVTYGTAPAAWKDLSGASIPCLDLGNTMADCTNGERHMQMHNRALHGETVSYELREGDKAFYARVAPLRSHDGRIIGCVGAAVDITHRHLVMERLRELASTDPMTGLANYRRLIDCMELEIKRCERSKRSFSIVMLDLDGLKTINDSYGHLCGSRAICRVANALRSQCRATDLAARYGGDEFCIVLPETPMEGAKNTSKRIAECLAAEAEAPSISVSAGAATYPTHGRTADQLILAADQGLYAAKGHRRGAANKRS
jgi:diguanylate cyclase (GGDEF)-like protein